MHLALAGRIHPKMKIQSLFTPVQIESQAEFRSSLLHCSILRNKWSRCGFPWKIVWRERCYLRPWRAVKCVHPIWTGCDAHLSSDSQDFHFKRVWITCFNNQFGISGLLKTWITPDKLCGAMSCFFFQKFLSTSEHRNAVFRCEVPKMFHGEHDHFIVFSQTILWYLLMATKQTFEELISWLYFSPHTAWLRLRKHPGLQEKNKVLFLAEHILWLWSSLMLAANISHLVGWYNYFENVASIKTGMKMICNGSSTYLQNLWDPSWTSIRDYLMQHHSSHFSLRLQNNFSKLASSLHFIITPSPVC